MDDNDIFKALNKQQIAAVKCSIGNKLILAGAGSGKTRVLTCRVAELINNYDVKCSVSGGGLSGQAGAIILGISRALIKMDPELRPKLKKAGLLTRDARKVERKKYGLKKARRAEQFTKR